jgi:hypothetical protein
MAIVCRSNPSRFLAAAKLGIIACDAAFVESFLHLVVAGPLALSFAATYSTPNFVVQTADATLARQFAEAAEAHRYRLAIEWLGQPLPDWSQPCPITVHVGSHLGSGGATSFVFDRGEVFGWRMTIQGPPERIIDSVLPHEITHMILASYFRRPLPRWADEGAATSVEHPSERAKYHRMLQEFLRTGRLFPLPTLFQMKEYPANMLALYAQGYVLTEFLIEQGGRRKFVQFLESALSDGNWQRAFREHYGYTSLGKLHGEWLAWIQRGCPRLDSPRPSSLPGDTFPQFAGGKPPRPLPNLIYHVRPGDSLPPVQPPQIVAAAPLVAVDEVSLGIPTTGLAARNSAVSPSVAPGAGIQGWPKTAARGVDSFLNLPSPQPSLVSPPPPDSLARNAPMAPFTPGSIRLPESVSFSTGVHVSLPFDLQTPRPQTLR